MSSNGVPARADRAVPEPVPALEASLSRWRKLRLVLKVIELRLRFVALMVITGLGFAYWDTIGNRYDKWVRPGPVAHAAARGFEFYCPMHPHVRQDEPGSCPVCGMPLARRTKGELPILPEGVTARVVLAPARVEQAGIRTAEVAYEPLNQVVTTVGYVAFDERRLATIVSKVPGKSRVEKLLVNVTGQQVEAGQPLAELYSPELSQAIEELLNASRRSGPAAEPQSEIARSLGNERRDLVRASTEKLRRWGIAQAQIDEVLAKGRADFAMTVLSPQTGHVFKKNVVEGQEVPEGYPMFEVIDLDTVWVQAQVYEHDLGLIHEGQAARATVPAFPGESFPGRLDFMQTHLDPATRTVEVRYALKNPGHRLRPGMFATVTLSVPIASRPEFADRAITSEPPAAAARVKRATLSASEQKNCPVTAAKLGSMGEPIAVHVEGRMVWTCCAACPPRLKAQPARYMVRLDPAPAGEVLSVPESAVIETGTTRVVYVESAPGAFEGREVVLGPRAGDRFPVIEGLAPGEKVAAAGAFLIDAESRLNPAPVRPRPGDSPPRSDHVAKPSAGTTVPTGLDRP
jgi:Cu(I)/Ag(I) efflux system membrane fusion protein